MERFSGDDDFRVMKANYVKNQADSALKAGNLREAYLRYTECLNVMPGNYKEAHAVYSNRSLAYSKAGKFDLALMDAEKACTLRVDWDKAWWRKASALRGLKQLNKALEAYSSSYILTSDKLKSYNEYLTAVTETTQIMTREQLAEYVVAVLNEYETKGLVATPSEQNVTEYEKREAMFCHIRDWNRDGHKSERDYCKFISKWALKPMSVTQAYLQRACMYKEAFCFKQVVVDAKAAIILCGSRGSDENATLENSDDVLIRTVLSNPGTPNPYEKRKYHPRAWAWFLQGIGYKATKSSEADRNLMMAAKCFSIAIKLDAQNSEFQAEFDSMCSQLSNQQMDVILSHKNGQQLISKFGLPEAYARDDFKGQLYKIDGNFQFECEKLSSFGGCEREAFKRFIADKTGVTFRDVLIENVILVSPGPLVDRHLQVMFQIHLGERTDQGQACLERLTSVERLHSKEEVILRELIGNILHQSGTIKELNLCKSLENPFEDMNSALLVKHDSGAVVEASRPSLELDLPYRSYSLVHADGSAVERVDKHPFCMSRVHYDKSDVSQDVWFQPSDSKYSYRWQQSASEVQVLVDIVGDACASTLEVDIRTQSLRVSCISTKFIFLDGILEESVIPDECVWDFEKGVLTLHLQKSNTNLFADPGIHSLTEWRRLMRESKEVKWDDTEKNYSDLPSVSMDLFRIQEEMKDAMRLLSHNYTAIRERSTELDEARRRLRQQRLAILRGCEYAPWESMVRDSCNEKFLAGGRDD